MRNFDRRSRDDVNDEAKRIGPSTEEQFGDSSFLEVHNAFDTMMLNEARSDSESRLMEDDVGAALDNFAKVDPDFDLDYTIRKFSRGFRYTGRRKMLEDAEERILDAQKKFPEAGLKTWSELLAGVQEKTKEDRELAQRTFANARGMARAGTVTGAMTGIITDPLILATMPLGAAPISGAGILGNATKAFKVEALIAGASEMAIQPSVYNWKKDIKSPYSVQEAAFNVMTAMVGAGTLRATGSALVDVVEIRGAAKLKRAEGTKLSNQEADILEQYADDIEAGGPETVEHFDNLDKAMDDLDRGQTSSAGKTAEHVEEIDPQTVGIDAEQFQFKAGTDAEGLSDRLQGVERWDPKMAGIAIIYENTEGARYIVDGHQRVGLARHMIANGQDPAEVKLNGIVLREADGVTVSDARQIAAVKNIAEGTGSAVDTAKVFRELGESGLDLMPSLPPKSALVAAGRGLSNLDDEAFSMVINGVVDEKVGAIVGEIITDAAEQRAVITALSQSEPANLVQARIMINDMKAAGFQRTETEDLFGGQEIAESLFQERAKILDNSLKRLRQDKKTFKTLEARSGDIAGEGNVLNREANQARVVSDEQTLAELTRLANTKGPISDALNQAARDIKEGKAVSKATEDFLDTVRRAEPEQRAPGAGAGTAGQPGETGNLIAEVGKPVRLQELAEADVLPAEVAFREAQMDKSMDDIYKVASTRQGQLTRVNNKIAKEIGEDKVVYISPGVKLRKKAEKRLIDKGKQPGEMTDIVRGGFMARDVEDSDRIVDMLAAKYKIIDEGIVAVDMGYVDRKVLVQFDDGIIGEVQIWEPHMLAAKEGEAIYDILPKALHDEWVDPDQVIPQKGKTGHDFYDNSMELVENGKVPAKNRAAFDAIVKEALEDTYTPAIRLANRSWKELIESRLPDSMISGGATARQSPGSEGVGIKKPAIEPSASSTTTAGRASQSNQPVTSESKKGVSMSESIADSETGVKDDVLDLFGEDTRAAQAMHDARLQVEKDLNPDNVVPVEAGPGDLFSGKSRQVELEDEVDRLIYERDLDIPEGVMVDPDGKIVATARGSKEVYDELDQSMKAITDLEGCQIGEAA